MRWRCVRCCFCSNGWLVGFVSQWLPAGASVVYCCLLLLDLFFGRSVGAALASLVAGLSSPCILHQVVDGEGSSLRRFTFALLCRRRPMHLELLVLVAVMVWFFHSFVLLFGFGRFVRRSVSLVA